MAGIIDADTLYRRRRSDVGDDGKEMYPRRPVLLKSPEDTLYGPRNAFWLIDGNIFPKPNGKGSFRLITPSATKLETSRGDIHLAYREMTDIPGRLKDMDKLNVETQVVYPTLFLIYITDDVAKIPLWRVPITGSWRKLAPRRSGCAGWRCLCCFTTLKNRSRK